MRQHELLQQVAEAFLNNMTLARPFRFFAVDSLPMESDDVEPTIRMMPSGLRWSRERKNHVQKTHKIDFVVSGPVTEKWTPAWYLNGIETVVETWLETEPVEDALFVGAQTVPGAEPGYIRENLYDTPQTFLGGVVFEFFTWQ